MTVLLDPSPTPILVPARSPWGTALLAAGAVWAATTVARLAVSALAWLPRGGGETPDVWMILLGWNKWDAGHYVQIAEHGYHLGPGFPAFYPVYPLLIRLFDPALPGGALISALIIANVAAVGALAVLHRLADHEFGPRVARRAIWYLAAFPTGFFLFIGYNESLFILLSLGALYAGRRGHWWLAGALGALSSGTRLFGLLLVVPLAIEYLRQVDWQPRRARADVAALAMVPLGLLAYSVYCWIDLGSPLAFSIAQDQWGREYTLPGGAWLTAVQQIDGRGLLDPVTLAAVIDAGTVLIAAGLLVFCVAGPYRFRRDQMYLIAHAATASAVLTMTEVGGRAMMSASRFTLEAAAVFLVLARMGARDTVDRAILTVGMALQGILLAVFMAGTFLVA
ncbi:mannosyltransferase family protein [Actinoplanes couchii]|uniref:Integral membrane protein n=1 Tax=Actinoplanes couchii TaxID=403638 RepID=A0ABQ3XU18_9ACTN|nr:mannosyltransferase family protein [Actinoplanes couchii]MDR6318684.1 hypothetical protein [Actinoplanes couchii]GID62016.1 hypothetical protein Aco03nite_104200 [Actinoplanes couchii]